MTPPKNDERSYAAFISYRHLPLDREAAIRIQKRIESFVVPREYRNRTGGKKLGLCFRDEDELPASASLSGSIKYALDHSKFLIVICTPHCRHMTGIMCWLCWRMEDRSSHSRTCCALFGILMAIFLRMSSRWPPTFPVRIIKSIRKVLRRKACGFVLLFWAVPLMHCGRESIVQEPTAP